MSSYINNIYYVLIICDYYEGVLINTIVANIIIMKHFKCVWYTEH